MAILHPRKQTLFIFVICLAIVLVAGLYMYDQNQSKVSILNNVSISSSTEYANIPISTNTDWKKSFYDASTTNNSYKTTKNNVNKIETLTDTDQFGREFFAKYMELRQSGLTNNQDALNAAANEIIQKTAVLNQNPKTYGVSNIIVQTDYSVNALKVYAEKLISILKMFPDESEATIALNAFEQGDLSLLKKIDPVISNYKTMLNELTKTPAPKPLAQYHLDLINGLSTQIFNAESLRTSDKDPLRGLAAVSLEVSGLKSVYTALGEMQTYFSSIGITFSAEQIITK